MKNLIIFLFLMAAVTSVNATSFINGDFSSGATGWNTFNLGVSSLAGRAIAPLFELIDENDGIHSITTLDSASFDSVLSPRPNTSHVDSAVRKYFYPSPFGASICQIRNRFVGVALFRSDPE